MTFGFEVIDFFFDFSIELVNFIYFLLTTDIFPRSSSTPASSRYSLSASPLLSLPRNAFAALCRTLRYFKITHS